MWPMYLFNDCFDTMQDKVTVDDDDELGGAI